MEDNFDLNDWNALKESGHSFGPGSILAFVVVVVMGVCAVLCP